MNAKAPRDDQRVLDLLDAVGKNSNVSQRHLAREMGVALGLTNSYLRRCIRKGYVKIRSAPANRYLYYLTPKGFSEKSRLTARYLTASFTFYRAAGESCVKALRVCESRGWRRVLLWGDSDLAEIAALKALEHEVEVIGVYDGDSDRSHLARLPVWRRLADAGPFDVCIVTTVGASRNGHDRLVAAIGSERVLVPDILRME